MEERIAVIGLGYVGLPLAVEFGKKYPTTGFDVKKKRVEELRNGIDRTHEVNEENLRSAYQLAFTYNLEDIKDASIYILAVPTPIDKNKKPDIRFLLEASERVGKVLKKGDLVVFESTVYPGCTEDDCIPVLERFSGLKYNRDFYAGYSPERINPGDKERTVTRIKKVTSGSTPEVAEKVDRLYRSVIKAGTFKASSIKVAEAAKVIENCQRDLNIAFVNELALIFDKLSIDTKEVLQAAGTKWNFLPFKPGLVGGHCIGVDPYYLTHKAEEVGYHPQVILSGRRINDDMGVFVASKLVKLMIKKNHRINNSNVLILGITFKENCSDIRNTRVIHIIKELEHFGINVEVYDPLADKEEVMEAYGIKLIDQPDKEYSAILLATAHNEFLNMELNPFRNGATVVYDVKGALDGNSVDGRL